MRKSTLGALLSLAFLASCTIPDPQDHHITWQEGIRSNNVPLTIDFGPKRTSLKISERRALKELYDSFKSNRTIYARIYVEDRSLHKMSRKSFNRISSLKASLRTFGIPLQNISVFSWPEVEFGERKLDTIVAMLENRQLMPENCPGWKQSIDSDMPPEGEMDFGCANAFNIARLVKHRDTLIQGKELVSRDSSAKIRAVTHYQQGKVKDPRIAKASTDMQSTPQ
jgi:type IV pilus biogenesis protein CpaD/CtpE